MNFAEGLHGTEGSSDLKDDESNTCDTGFDANAKEVEIVSIICRLTIVAQHRK